MNANRNIVTACAGIAVMALSLNAGAQRPAPAKPVRVAAAPLVKAPASKAVTVAAAAPAEAQGQAISRETYTYQGSGRRDPFVSLMNSDELRPLFQDLKLVAVAFDATGRNSVAVLRDVTSKEQYRVKVGQEIGRMRVASISEKSVVFGIEEFGYSSQETLAMNDSTKVRTQ